MRAVGTRTVGGQRRVTEHPLPLTHAHPHPVSAVWSHLPGTVTSWRWVLPVWDRGSVPLSASLLGAAVLPVEGGSTLEASIAARAILQDPAGGEEHAAFLCPEWKRKEKPNVS